VYLGAKRRYINTIPFLSFSFNLHITYAGQNSDFCGIID